MTGAVSLALAADEPASRRVADALFPKAEHRYLTRDELRPPAPFTGPLFEILAARDAQDQRAAVGLVVPVVWLGAPSSGGSCAPAALPPGALLAIADHVNLELRGPLTAGWPAAIPRVFPALTGIYQPALVRARGGPRVYSSGVVVAGVTDAERLTPFEARAVSEGGVVAVSDSLVPPAIVAAYYGLTLAACGVPQADDNDEE